MTRYKYPVVMTIAGFDGSGGAGIQADIKTISALGCYATSVLTALPVQNTTGVRSIHSIAPEVVREQIACLIEDIMPDAIKIGMVHTPEMVAAIVSGLESLKHIPIVFDPVMVATSGDRLIEGETIRAMREMLFPLATLITPNMDEAAILASRPVQTVDDIEEAGRIIRQSGVGAVLVKGGHLNNAQLTSVLFEGDHRYSFSQERINTHNTHGSGCSLSSAIASWLALGKNLKDAVDAGQQYVHQALVHGARVTTGKGNGPLNHFHNPQKMNIHEMV